MDSFSKSLIKQKEDAIIFEVQRSLGVDVDRGELLQALQYNRFQYDKGYADGKADAMAKLVRCKDCKHYGYEPYDNGDKCCVRWEEWIFPFENDFCSCGERKDKE